MRVLTVTGDKIACLKSSVDQSNKSVEINRCQEQYDDLNERWIEAKKEIERQLRELDLNIGKAESGELVALFGFETFFSKAQAPQC